MPFLKICGYPFLYKKGGVVVYLTFNSCRQPSFYINFLLIFPLFWLLFITFKVMFPYFLKVLLIILIIWLLKLFIISTTLWVAFIGVCEEILEHIPTLFSFNSFAATMEARPSQGVPIGSIQARLWVWDLNSTSQEEEVDERNVQGIQSGCVYIRGQWSMVESLILYMEWYAERGPGSSNRHIHLQTTTQKWDTILEWCNDMGVVKTPDQCKDKWDQTQKDFKKV